MSSETGQAGVAFGQPNSEEPGVEGGPVNIGREQRTTWIEPIEDPVAPIDPDIPFEPDPAEPREPVVPPADPVPLRSA
jgi:hypothetical protein